MARQRPRKKAPRQLYTILGQLHNVEEGERELGLLVSYAIANSLLQFRSESGSDDEIHHQQVKAIYDGLESAVTSCQSQGSQDTLFTLQPTVDQAIQRYIADPNTEIGSSELLKLMFDRLSESCSKNPADRLKRDGISLYRDVVAEGIRRRNVDALVGDYKLLKDRLG